MQNVFLWASICWYLEYVMHGRITINKLKEQQTADILQDFLLLFVRILGSQLIQDRLSNYSFDYDQLTMASNCLF